MSTKQDNARVHALLTRALRAEPFRPFDLRMADGDAIHVAHPDLIARAPGSPTATVYTRGGHARIVPLNEVAMVALTRAAARQPGVTAGDLRALKRVRPFGRHTVTTRDGESFRLTRPDWMLVDPRGHTFICYDDRGRTHHLHVRQIASIEPARPTRAKAGGDA